MTAEQRRVVDALADALDRVPGVQAVALGGSHASGRARPDSDIDLGLFYADEFPPEVDAIRAIAGVLNDTPDPVVTEPYVWGRWVNGGAWLRIEGERYDLIYRSVDHVLRTVDACAVGEFELDFAQQPPFGFASPMYLGEIEICVPLRDRDGVLAGLKQRVAVYPEALRSALVSGWLWAVEFNLGAFAPKFAARGDGWGTASCLSRAVFQLAHVVLALNRRYPLNDKTLIEDAAALAEAPREFATRVSRLMAPRRADPETLAAAIESAQALLDETIAFAGTLYPSRRLA